MDRLSKGCGGLIDVEVVYATSDLQALVQLQVHEGCTVREAVELSGLAARFPEIVVAELPVGIFSVVRKPDHVLTHGDRVEIYRSLVRDPKESRRQRALKK